MYYQTNLDLSGESNGPSKIKGKTLMTVFVFYSVLMQRIYKTYIKFPPNSSNP